MNPRRWFRSVEMWAFQYRRAEFYRDLAEMYQRNESLMAFLEGEIANSIRTRQSSRTAALRRLLFRYQSGDSAGQLGPLLGTVMPRSDAMMLVGVDRATDKPQALRALADAVERQSAMRSVVLAHAALPLLMLPICYGLIRILSGVIISIDRSTPEFAREELWRGLNGVARLTAEITLDWGLGLFGLLLGSIALAMWSLPRWRGPARRAMEDMPVYGLYRDFQSGLLVTALAMLLKTGSPLRAAIEDIAQRSSMWMRWHLSRVLSALDDKPTGMLEAFSRGVMSTSMLARAATLMRTADSFSDVLIELGTREENRVLRQVRHAARAANLAVVGLLVALASFMGLASITVPGKFSTLMQPASMMALRQAHEAKRQASAVLMPPVLPASSASLASGSLTR